MSIRQVIARMPMTPVAPAPPVTTPPIIIPSITLPGLVVTLIIAALIGALAQLILGYTRGGCLMSLLVGLVGALLGSWIASILQMPPILELGGVDVIWTLIGSAVFVLILSLVMGGRRYRGFRRRYE